MSESTEQILFVKWFRVQHKKYWRNIFSVPNGFFVPGVKDMKMKRRIWGLIKKLKAEGMTNGVSDIFIAVTNSEYSGLFIEFKDVGKSEKDMSVDQVAFFEAVAPQGYKTVCCAGFDEAKKVTKEYMKTVKQ